jgi:hypothetical protein
LEERSSKKNQHPPSPLKGGIYNARFFRKRKNIPWPTKGGGIQHASSLKLMEKSVFSSNITVYAFFNLDPPELLPGWIQILIIKVSFPLLSLCQFTDLSGIA